MKLIVFRYEGSDAYGIRYAEPVPTYCDHCWQATEPSDAFPGHGGAIEGSAAEMREVAKAIRARGRFSACRVSVKYIPEDPRGYGGPIAARFFFGMPRNAADECVTVEVADDIAEQIERVVR